MRLTEGTYRAEKRGRTDRTSPAAAEVWSKLAASTSDAQSAAWAILAEVAGPRGSETARLVRLAARFTRGNLDRANDVVQDVVLGLASKYMHEVVTAAMQGYIVGYVNTAVRNHALNLKTRTRETEELEGVALAVLPETSALLIANLMGAMPRNARRVAGHILTHDSTVSDALEACGVTPGEFYRACRTVAIKAGVIPARRIAQHGPAASGQGSARRYGCSRPETVWTLLAWALAPDQSMLDGYVSC